MLALFLNNCIPQYNKLLIEKSKEIEKERVNVEKSEIEEFFQALEKNCSEAEKRRKQEEQTNTTVEVHKKTINNSNEFVLYKSIEGFQMNNIKNVIFNISRESGNASSKLLYLVDPLEMYQSFGKILQLVDEKMFDFDMKVTECLVKIKYNLKKKELPFKSLYK